MAAHRCLYVSPAGDDAQPGTEEAPFATLEQAQHAVRRQPAAAAVTVYLGEGTHRLTARLTLTPADSGTAEAPVVWRAKPGERPVVSGGVALEAAWSH